MASLLQQIETVPVGSLELYPGNPRRGDVGAIAVSLRENEQYAPLVVQRSTRYVLAGNHTLKAAVSLGWSEVDVVFVDVDDQRARKILLSANRTAELPGPDGFRYDDDELAQLLSYLDEDYEGTGWTAEDVEALITPPEDFGGGGSGDPDDVPEPPAQPQSTLGDLYLLGPHRLLVADSTDPDNLARLMSGELADMIWTDPPYNVAVTGGTHDPRDKKNHGKGPKIANDSMGDLEFRGFLCDAFASMAAHLKPGGAAYVCHADTEGLNFRAAYAEGGLELHQVLIWVKQQFVFGRSDYHWQHEPIIYGWKPGAAHAFHGERNQSTIWEIDRPMRSAMEHPTQKPVDLVTIALHNSSLPQELILDPFGGSGSTLIAAHQIGRVARLCELDPRYADVICLRWEQVSGMKPERVLPDGTTEPVSFT